MCRDGRKSKSPDSRSLRNIRHVRFFAPTISAISLATLGFSAIQTFIILFCSLNEETKERQNPFFRSCLTVAHFRMQSYIFIFILRNIRSMAL